MYLPCGFWWKGAKERYFSLSNPRRLGWGYDQVVPTLVIRYMNSHTFTLGSGTERQLLVVVARSSPQEMPAQTELLTSLANNRLLNTNPRLLKIAKDKMLTWFLLFLLRFHQLRSPPLWSSRIRNSIRLWIWAVLGCTPACGTSELQTYYGKRPGPGVRCVRWSRGSSARPILSIPNLEIPILESSSILLS